MYFGLRPYVEITRANSSHSKSVINCFQDGCNVG